MLAGDHFVHGDTAYLYAGCYDCVVAQIRFQSFGFVNWGALDACPSARPLFFMHERYARETSRHFSLPPSCDDRHRISASSWKLHGFRWNRCPFPTVFRTKFDHRSLWGSPMGRVPLVALARTSSRAPRFASSSPTTLSDRPPSLPDPQKHARAAGYTFYTGR